MKTKTIPTSITATRAVTFNTERIALDIAEENDKPFSEVTLEEVMARVEEWADEDLSSAYERNYYVDENGEEVNF